MNAEPNTETKGQSPELAPRFVARLGLAVVSPRWALAVAGDRRFAGRSGSDFIVAILLLLAATQLRGLIGAVWLGIAVNFGFGLRALMHVLTRALTVDLAFLVLGAIVVWAAAGAKRNLGRAFDLACVAALPLLFVDIGATDVVRLGELDVPDPISWVLVIAAWCWAGALLALALRPARVAPVRTPAPPPEVVGAGRRAGFGVMTVVLLGVVVQSVWIAHHIDVMRPVTTGEDAPAFALPEVGPKGVLGPPTPLVASRGQVTVIDFWATWCGPCLKAMPELDKLAREPGVVVLAINLDDPARARAMFDEHGYAMHLLADNGDVSERYGVTTIPHTIVVDHDGKVRTVSRGTGMPAIAAMVEQIRK
jgi:thiol-disulfide isomerase/thioredoxin